MKENLLYLKKGKTMTSVTKHAKTKHRNDKIHGVTNLKNNTNLTVRYIHDKMVKG